MALARVDNCGMGLNSDLTPEELGNGVWSAVQNMRFANGYAERYRGTSQLFDAPSVTPYFLTPYATTTTRFWVHAGLAAVYVDDGTTRTDITGTAIRLGHKQTIAFEGTDTITLSLADNWRVAIKNGNTPIFEIDIGTGDIYKKGKKVL